MSLNLHIKHSAKVYDVSIPSESQGITLKQRLEELTEVPVAKQKILVKGKQLKDDLSLEAAGVKDGQSLFMLGTAPKNVVPSKIHENTLPEQGSNLADDQDEDDNSKNPAGILNTGNTCYANSTLQALHTVPELNQALTNYHGNNGLLQEWGRIVPQFGFDSKTPTKPMYPFKFLEALRSKLSQFAEREPTGGYKQQDAEELYTELMSSLKSDPSPAVHDVVHYFEGEFAVKKFPGKIEDVGESNDEDAVMSSGAPTEESFSKLMCHINVKTNFLKDGLRASLLDEVELGEGDNTENFTIKKQISKAPKYLIVQFVRFFWRKDTKVNSKILRKVTFPTNLDVGDLCTEELQSRMAPARNSHRELEGAIEEQKRAARRAKFQRVDAVPDDPADTNADEVAAAKRRAAAAAEDEESEREKQHLESLKDQFRKNIDPALAADKTCSPHGLYDLQAIISHQGMSADSGHYLCYTRSPHDPNQWWKLNDDQATPFDSARIATLAGGGASDSALILVYKSSDI